MTSETAPKVAPKLMADLYAAKGDDLVLDIRWVKDMDSAVDLALKTGAKFIDVYEAQADKMGTVITIAERTPVAKAYVGFDKVYDADALLTELRSLRPAQDSEPEALRNAFGAEARRAALIDLVESKPADSLFVWYREAEKEGVYTVHDKEQVFGSNGEAVQIPVAATPSRQKVRTVTAAG